MMSPVRSYRASRWFVCLGWTVFLVVVLGPIYWIVAASFKTPDEIISKVPTPWPRQIYLGNYRYLFSSTDYPTYLMNSVVVAVGTMVGTAVVATLAGYAMYRLRIRGAAWLSRFLLLSYLAPSTLLLVPIYSLLASLDLLNDLAGLVIVNVAFASPFCVWLLRGFFDEIPPELDEAALVDGAGPIGVLMRINLPLLAPGLGTVLLYAFVYSWTEYVFASQLIIDDDLKTVPVGLSAVMGSYNINWGLLMAAAATAMVPAAFVFALVGRYFARGLSSGAVTR